jgi:hypothetical protein
MPSIDFSEVLVRLTKYAVEGLVVALVALLLPSKQLTLQEVILLALTAAAVFSILDLMAPSIASGTRLGVGLSTGVGLMGI